MGRDPLAGGDLLTGTEKNSSFLDTIQLSSPNSISILLKGGESLEYTNDRLNTIRDKLAITQRYADYLEEIDYQRKLKLISESKEEEALKPDSTLNKRERMKKCLDYWKWDLYQENKLMDLVKLNRCMDRYCPNCRSVSLAISIKEFAPQFMEMRSKGYYPYLITLTNPNCEDHEMKQTLDTMGKAWSKFYRWYSHTGGSGYKDRLFNLVAAIRFTEVTRNEKNSNHNHFHILAFTDGSEDPEDFIKQYQGEWSTKRQTYDMLSKADLQIRELWYRAFNNIRMTKECNDSYICDIREMANEKGIYEVFKYCFKDTDIKDFEDFQVIYEAFKGRRIRQGYGELYNLKLEFDEEEIDKEKEDTIEQYLLTNKNEIPCKLLTEFSELFTLQYHDYKKISRFKISEIIDKIEKQN